MAAVLAEPIDNETFFFSLSYEENLCAALPPRERLAMTHRTRKLDYSHALPDISR